MKKISFLLTVILIIFSCNSENHYHDGQYQTNILFAQINYQINGNEITIDNSVTGISKLSCTQYSDRIEYEEDNGTTRILTALENGDLKFSDMIILHKIIDEDGSTKETSKIQNKDIPKTQIKENKKASNHSKNLMKFCEESDSWYYTAEINGNQIVLKSYPTKSNTAHKNKGVSEIIHGRYTDGKITIERPKNCEDCWEDYETGRFKIENDILYEENNEGGYNEYHQCE